MLSPRHLHCPRLAAPQRQLGRLAVVGRRPARYRRDHAIAHLMRSGGPWIAIGRAGWRRDGSGAALDVLFMALGSKSRCVCEVRNIHVVSYQFRG